MSNYQDTDLRQKVVDELEFEPSLGAANIGVAVHDGIVTMTGHVPTYAEKLSAERVAARVKGVRGIAQEIEVRPAGTNLTADDEIARRAADVLKWTTSVPRDTVRVKVSKGYLTLEGLVEWNYQRVAAENAVHGISGVTGISNFINIQPKVSAVDVRQKIESALKRDAEVEAAAIRVAVSDGTVTLEGKVHSLSERYAAERAAWAAPGVRKVEDHLRVA